MPLSYCLYWWNSSNPIVHECNKGFNSVVVPDDLIAVENKYITVASSFNFNFCFVVICIICVYCIGFWKIPDQLQLSDFTISIHTICENLKLNLRRLIASDIETLLACMAIRYLLLGTFFSMTTWRMVLYGISFMVSRLFFYLFLLHLFYNKWSPVATYA